MKLFPHNQKAFEAVMNTFAVQDRAAVVHATGTGKSYIGAAVAEHFSNVLVIAPVAFILNEHRKVHKNNVTFATYAKLLHNYETIGIGFDLIILDEFHRAGAEGWGAAVNNLIEDNPHAKILGLTATNMRYLENRDMAEELFDNAVVSTLSLKDAILEHILTAPKCIIGYYTFGVTYKKYQEKISASTAKEEVKNEAHKRLDNIRLNWEKAYNVNNLLKKHLPDYAKRVIVFCQNHSMLNSCKKSVKKWFNDAGFKVYKTYYVNHDEQKLSRDNMEEFQVSGYDGIKIMFAVDMLNEGVHVPNVDAVIMLRKTISKNIYLQQIGRCLTAGESRQPVIFDLVANATRANDLQEWREIKAAYDKSELDNGRGSGKDNTTDFVIEDYTMEIQTFLDSVDNMLPHVSDLWDQRKPLIDAHYARTGHLPTMEENPTLHIYIKSFCYKRDERAISDRSKTRLEAIRQHLMSMGFDPNTYARDAFDTLEEVRISTEERGYYTSYEFIKIQSNTTNNSEEYRKAFDEFIDTHYSKLMYEHIRLLTDILPTIDWCKEQKDFSKEQQRCARLAKGLYNGKSFARHTDKYNDTIKELVNVNPFIPKEQRTKVRIIRFVTEKKRLPATQHNSRARISYDSLTEEQKYEDNLYRRMCLLKAQNDPEIIALCEKYKREVISGEDIMLNLLEDFIREYHRYPSNKIYATNAEKALARRVSDYKTSLNEEQKTRYELITKNVSTPEKSKTEKKAIHDKMISEIIRKVKEQGYRLGSEDGELYKWQQWYKSSAELSEIKCYPTYREYMKEHPEFNASKKVISFIDEFHRLPNARVTAETYTARCIKRYIWFTPIFEAVKPYADEAPSFLYDTIHDEIKKRLHDTL